MNELHLFAGAGGGILGGMLLGHTCVCAVEIEPYPRRVLLQRQRDGILPQFPIWDDICTFDGRPWRGHVDIVCGGFPCQDISAAGKGAGIDGERSGLWGEMARVIRQVRPRYVFVENSPMLTSRGLHRVLGDLAAMGFDARWGVLGADDAGASHKRKRIWILADANGVHGEGFISVNADPEIGENSGERPLGPQNDGGCRSGWWSRDPADEAEPGMGRVADGVAHRVDRLRAIGNGQVPSVAALAWRILDEQP